MARRRTAHWKFLLWIVSVLAVSVVATWLIDTYLPSMTSRFGRLRIFRRVASIAGVAGVFLLQKHIERQPLSALGFGPWRQGLGDLWLGVRLGVLTLAALMMVLWWCGVWHIALNPDHQKLWRALGSCVPSALLVGCMEELVFRGYLLRTLLREYSVNASVGLTSAVYALAHLAKPIALWPSMWTDLVGLWLFGAILAYAVLRTQALYLSIGLHASLVYLVKIQKHLIEFDPGAFRWLFGNQRLLTGVLGWVALGALGWYVHRTTQHRALPHGR